MMKKVKTALAVMVAACLLSSCATILGGPITEHQKTKPGPGEPKRQVRIGSILGNLVFGGIPGWIIDFSTGAAYKPKK